MALTLSIALPLAMSGLLGHWRWALIPVAPLVVYLVFMVPVRRARRLIVKHKCELCMRCKYPLTGLPEQGSCPECGEPYTIEEARRHWAKFVKA